MEGVGGGLINKDWGGVGATRGVLDPRMAGALGAEAQRVNLLMKSCIF